MQKQPLAKTASRAVREGDEEGEERIATRAAHEPSVEAAETGHPLPVASHVIWT